MLNEPSHGESFMSQIGQWVLRARDVAGEVGLVIGTNCRHIDNYLRCATVGK